MVPRVDLEITIARAPRMANSSRALVASALASAFWSSTNVLCESWAEAAMEMIIATAETLAGDGDPGGELRPRRMEHEDHHRRRANRQRAQRLR